MRIAPGLHRLGNGLVNAYLLDDGGEVTIIDAGMPGYWSALPRELESMGRSLADVRAIVLTHGHSDHIGFAERARRERGLPVSVHELDAALARGEVPNPANVPPRHADAAISTSIFEHRPLMSSARCRSSSRATGSRCTGPCGPPASRRSSAGSMGTTSASP